MISKLQRLAKFSARYAEDFADETFDLAEQALKQRIEGAEKIEEFIKERITRTHPVFEDDRSGGAVFVYKLGMFKTHPITGELVVIFDSELTQDIVKRNETEGFIIGERFSYLRNYTGLFYSGIALAEGQRHRQIMVASYGKPSARKVDAVAYEVATTDLDQVFGRSELTLSRTDYDLIKDGP